MAEYSLERCSPSNWQEALALLFDELPSQERDEQLRQMTHFAEWEPHRFDGLLVCRKANRIVGSVLCWPAPGRTAMILPPHTSPDLPSTLRLNMEMDLVDLACATSAQFRPRMAQTLLTQPHAALEQRLQRHGFFHLTDLLLLEAAVGGNHDCERVTVPLDYQCFSMEMAETFQAVVAATYEESHDCPELSGLRTMPEVFEGHQSQGEFDPRHWLLARRGDAWVGCLLLADLPECLALEVTYLGVMPPARGQGVGSELVRQAFRVAKAAGAQRIALAVDERNLPARHLYANAGFQILDQQRGFLKVFDPADGRFDRRASTSW